MRVLFLTQWFEPEPFYKGVNFARALEDLGHEVEILTGFPNYPGGKLYPGYKIRPWQKEVMNGVNVTRLPLYPSHDESGIRRMINYSSFGLSAAAIGPFLVKKPDIIHVYNLVTLGMASSIMRMLGRCKVVYDIQDLWPDTVTASGMMSNRFAQGILGSICNSTYKRADHITVLSPGMKAVLVERGIQSDRIDVIYNWCDEDTIECKQEDLPAIRKELGFDGYFNVVFAGTMGKMQALDSILDAAELVMHKNPLVKFTFIGGGIEVDHLKARTMQMGLSNVQFLPRRPVSEIGKVLSATDALLVHLKDNPLFSITIPGKIPAYLYAGKPIIAAVDGDSADLVINAGAGLHCKPEDSHSISEAVLKLSRMDAAAISQFGINAHSFYSRELSFATGVKQFDRVYRNLIHG